MILSPSQMIQANTNAAAHAATVGSAPRNVISAFPESPSTTSLTSSSSSSPSASLFPTKLHAMLEDARMNRFDDVVCWLEGGASFKVLDPARFTSDVMPKYFNQRKYKSFLRQLNLYGFQRVHHGPHKGGYAHKYFLQGVPSLCERINKSTPRSKEQMMKSHRRVVSADAFSPQFYAEAMESPRSESPVGISEAGNFPPMYVRGRDEGVAVLSDLDDSNSTRSRRSSGSSVDFSPAALTPLPMETPVNAAVTQEAIQHILPGTATNIVQNTPVNEIFHEEPNSFMAMDTQVEKALLSTFVEDDREMEKDIGIAPIGLDKTLADDLLAIVNDEPTARATITTPPAPAGWADVNVAPPPPAPFVMTTMSPLATGAFSEFNFPRKVYRMLDDAEANPFYKSIVSWAEEGMAFRVHNKKLFVEKILPIYFDMTQYASFRRQLNMYSFERKHTSTYSNPFFVRGCPDLLEKITRKSGSKKSSDKKD